MKKLIILTALLIPALFANAQKGEFTISAGTTGNPMAQALQSNDLSVTEKSVPIHLEAGYYLSNKIQLSVAFNTSSAKSKDLINNYSLTMDGKATSVMLRFNYFYVNKEKFKLGSGLAMGLVNIDGNASITPVIDIPVSLDKNGFGLHLNLLEARYFFTDHIGIYANAGFQDQGLWGLGVIGKF